MRGITAWGTYLPHRRLDRGSITPVAGGGGGKGARTVASYDEDTTTMGVEAARRALRVAADPAVDSLWFSTVDPAYLDKTNATTIQAALRLPRATGTYDALGSVRSAAGALRAAGRAAGPALAVLSDLRVGLPGGPDEAAGGDGAAALLLGEDAAAELVAWQSSTEEFVDRWRTPGDVRSKLWEERFGETRYLALALEAWAAALKEAGLAADQVDHLAVAGLHERAVRAFVKQSGVAAEAAVDAFAATVGNTGAAQPGVLLAAALERARAGQVVGLVVLADGADALVLRTTPVLDEVRARIPAASTVAEQAAGGSPITYGKYLAWRGLLPVEPPRRPEPARPSASAAGRSLGWKFGFVGSTADDGTVHLPPALVDSQPRPMADATGTIATFTIDKLAYSPSPPVVFAVVDFDGGGRVPLELTDVDPAEVAIGDRVEMTFRRLFTADGIHNYFWKGRPVRGGR